MATIYKDERLRIKYINNKLLGQRITTSMKTNKKDIFYNFYLSKTGNCFHISRYNPITDTIKRKNRLDDYRYLEYLITDTLNRQPHYNNNEINGFYDPAFFTGKYEVEKLKKSISRGTKNEFLMFDKMREILLAKNIKFNQIDSTKILGWFKYEF